jgi:tryptophanase
MNYLIEVVQEVYQIRRELRGMKFIREPKALRHFTGRFDYVD